MNDYIAHHGVKGQRWGVRKYVDENGKLTEVGKKKYASDAKKQAYKLESKKSSQEFKQQKALNEQASKHEKARRRGRMMAAIGLALVGATVAKRIINSVADSRIKLEGARNNNTIKLEKNRHDLAARDNQLKIDLQKAKHDYPTIVKHLGKSK